MSESRRAWITWILIVVSAVVVGIIRGQPIVIPPPPIQQPAPPSEQPPTPPGVVPDPINAIVRISRPGVGCSATFIWPRRADGRYWVLSAEHCGAEGAKWTARFRDGRSVGLTCVAVRKGADFAWLLSDVDTHIYPSAILRDTDPPVGTKVWHSGYGVDKPGNHEDGVVTALPNADGQIEFRLSVSSGDSGGGIMMDSNGHVISPVCCTTERGAVGRVWGASPVLARRGQVVNVDVDEWNPFPIPLKVPQEMPKDGK